MTTLSGLLRRDPPPPVEAPADEGVRCPRCDYNLTALRGDRCPECGQQLDWGLIRRTAAGEPAIAFEAARGWRKLPAFVQTVATVLLTPWTFARQIQQRVSAIHAAAFFALCFVPPGVVCLVEREPYFLPWVLTAAVCVVLEALLLWTLECVARTRYGAALRLWLCAGCYTTAVVATEFYLGPPVLFVTDMLEPLVARDLGTYQASFYYSDTPERVIYAAQIALWLTGLLWLLVARARRRGMTAARCVILASFATIGLILLYACVYQYVGWAIVWTLDRIGMMRI